MKITKIEVLHTRTALKKGHWRPILCRIYTDEGLFGDGEAALAYGEAQSAAFGMVQNLARLIIGMDPLDTEVIWDKLYRSTFWGQNGGPVFNAGLSAIDIALWDIKGKYFGVPVYKLLGGKKRDTLRAYASQLQFGWGPDIIPQLSLEDYAQAGRDAVEGGYDAVKYDFFTFAPDGHTYGDRDRMGLLPPSTVKLLKDRVETVRKAIGPDVDLIIENHSWTDANSAIQYGNAVKHCNIFYFEEPTTPTPQLSKLVGDKTGLPIASGERIYTRWQYYDYFKCNALQIIQPDIGTCGGISEVKKVCDMAYIFDVGVQVHACGSPISTAAALQVEAVIPNFVIHEHHTYALSPYNIALCKYNYQPVNGQYHVPDLPGIGQEIAEAAYADADIVTIQ
ncbi:MAG: mandelate racemase/muconate lactonizing enzyme family protein [Solobacterium sp.]|nr:mandelate racemase/muconate lactonizing enzyme family protein [Solobacterium sp.]